MSKLRAILVDLDRETSDRLLARLEGLTDDEYLWEPVAGCWSIRPGDDGVLRAEWELMGPQPPPLTTIAARIWHMGARPWPWPVPASVDAAIRVFFERTPVVPDGADPRSACATAESAIEALARDARARRDYYDSLSEAALATKLGPIAHQYADTDYSDLLLHMIDEQIHHGAEVGLMRDFYRVLGA